MKKVILSIALAMMSVSAMFAQSAEFKYGLGNRIGIGVGADTEGIGVDVSTCFNKYFGVRAGLNFMPDINIKTDVDILFYDFNVISEDGVKNRASCPNL